MASTVEGAVQKSQTLSEVIRRLKWGADILRLNAVLNTHMLCWEVDLGAQGCTNCIGLCDYGCRIHRFSGFREAGVQAQHMGGQAARQQGGGKTSISQDVAWERLSQGWEGRGLKCLNKVVVPGQDSSRIGMFHRALV